MAATDLVATGQSLLDCICEALEAAGRPVCSCYATIGAPMIANCCDCGDGKTGEAILSFERMYDADPQTLDQVNRVRPCRGGVTVAEFTVLVSRCYPTISETGDLPSPEDQDEAAAGLAADVETVWWSLGCCDDLAPRRIIQIAVDSDPEGGCSALAARVAVEVIPARPPVESP